MHGEELFSFSKYEYKMLEAKNKCNNITNLSADTLSVDSCVFLVKKKLCLFMYL